MIIKGKITKKVKYYWSTKSPCLHRAVARSYGGNKILGFNLKKKIGFLSPSFYVKFLLFFNLIHELFLLFWLYWRIDREFYLGIRYIYDFVLLVICQFPINKGISFVEDWQLDDCHFLSWNTFPFIKKFSLLILELPFTNHDRITYFLWFFGGSL